MSTKAKTPKQLVNLGLTNIPVSQLIQNSRQYVTHMTGNPYFPTPTPALATVSAATDLLESDYAVSQTRVRGSASVMRDQEKKLIVLLKALASHVELIANGNPPPGINVIPSAGMIEKKPSIHKPKTFTAVNGPMKGEVILNTKGLKGAAYVYQMNTDPNNLAGWQTIYMGTKVKFIKTGLTSGTHYFFRTALSSKGVQGDWSNFLDVIVM
jgi:hypothetical protein